MKMEKKTIYDHEWAKTLEEMDDESIEEEMDSFEEYMELSKKFDMMKYNKLKEQLKDL
jgi:hypothetical protein